MELLPHRLSGTYSKNRLSQPVLFTALFLVSSFCLFCATSCSGNQSSNGNSQTAVLALGQSAYSVTQSAGTLAVTINRTGSSNGTATVAYATSNGTAIADTDYSAASGTLTWASGDMGAKTVAIAISNAVPFSGVRSFGITLSNANGAAIGTPSSANIAIDGDAAATAPGTLVLSAASYPVAQSAGPVLITVNRSGGSSGSVSVTYATSNGTAAATTDYTATNGTLSWADGDATAKTFSVKLSTSTLFAGTKSFNVAISAPTGGATLGTPATASVVITGTAASGPGPSAVSNLELINQGGSGNAANPPTSATNTQQISWTAATPGPNPIDHYKIYRSIGNAQAVAYDTTTALTYTDKNAPNSNFPDYSGVTTIYSYNVSAVDTKGIEGPQAAQMAVYAYRNGISNWHNADLSFGGPPPTENYSSTNGSPQGGLYDVSILFTGGQGGFQPTSGWPQAPQWDLEIGAFKYFTVDVNPGATANFVLNAGTVSRVPGGTDVYGWQQPVNLFNYGPAPVANTWATYKIPMSDLHLGVCQFTGSISGTTLTVTALASGSAFVDNAGFVTGTGVPVGTYIVSSGQNNSIGTFTVAGPGISSSTSIPSETMTFQRTNLYKFALIPNLANQTTIYFNNMGFTAN